MALSCISSEIKPDIGRKSWFFHTPPPCIRCPRYGGPRRNIDIPFGLKKWNGGAIWWWKNFEDMYNRLDSIPACDRLTDRQTDRRTDILPRHSPRYAYASRGKNYRIFMKFCTQQQIFNWMNVAWSKLKKLHWTDSEFDRMYFFWKMSWTRTVGYIFVMWARPTV